MKHMTDFNSFVNESAKSDKLTPLLINAIDKVDNSLSYTDFAIAIANIIKDEYGSHNIKPFMAILQKELSVKELEESKDSDTFVGNPSEDSRMVDIRAFRGSVKDLTDFIEDKIKETQK